MENESEDVLRVLVVGELACGKSSLIHWLEHGGPPKRTPRPTVGCCVSVIESFGSPGFQFLVDLREVGGHECFSAARAVFYRDFDAVIIVVDASKASGERRQEEPWLSELETAAMYGPGHIWVSEKSPDATSDGPVEGHVDIEGGGARTSKMTGVWRSPNLFPVPVGRSRFGSGGDTETWVPRADGGPVPALLVANKSDLLPPNPDDDDAFDDGANITGGQKQSKPMTSRNARAQPEDVPSGLEAYDAVLSATDEHFDTRVFQDFFYRALRHKQVRRR